jgi:hypothetical protein
MYSREYKNFSKTIDSTITENFIKGHDSTIKSRALKPDQIHFRFSIMEMEAWVLGMYNFFAEVDPILTPEFIQEKLGYNLLEIDPETHFFKPASDLEKIYNLVGKKYDKKLGDIESIFSKIGKQDFIDLYNKATCKSYNEFCDVLIAVT